MDRTFTNLKSQIGNWLDDQSLTAYTEMFISMAEDRHARDVRVRANTVRSTAVGADDRRLPLPEGFLGMRRLREDDITKEPLKYLTPELIATEFKASGTPEFFTVHEELEFDVEIGSSTTLEILYFKKFDALSDTNASNWLLENAWGAYLFGALAEAADFIDDAESVAKWEGKYNAVIAKLADAERRERMPSGGRAASRYAAKDVV